MKSLHRKLFRDLWTIRGQAVAISLVIAAGVATFVMSLNMLHALRTSKDAYYERNRFAEVFASLKRAPLSLVNQVRQIDGIDQVDARIVVNVTIEIENMLEPATGRFVAIPTIGRPRLNDVYVRKGRYPEPRRGGEVLVSEPFADAHKLVPGDEIWAILNGRRQKLTIVGIALSPEYLIQILGGTLLPDNRRYGVFWMEQDQLAAAFDLEGAFNDLTATMVRGASEPEILSELDRLLEPYGGTTAYGREQHISNRYISDEIRQLGSMGMIAPTIFLLVATFLLNIVLSRQISMQREQIAALKAFGYSNVEVGVHYLQFVLLISVCGAVIGVGLGNWFGHGLTAMYSQFYKFPEFHFTLDYRIVTWALMLNFSAAAIGTYSAVMRAVRLPPAEAMRPEPPAEYRRGILDARSVQILLPTVLRMILRQFQRQKWKAFISIVGIALAAAVLVLGSFMADSIDYMMDHQFRVAQRQDLMVTFAEPSSRRAFHDVANLDGVLGSEPFRSVPARFRAGHRWKRVSIMGLTTDSELFRLVNVRQQTVVVPPDGLLLSDKLAEILGVQPGDEVTIEIQEGQRPTLRVPVTSIVTEYNGTNAYMELTALHRLMKESGSISGVFVDIDPSNQDQIFRKLRNSPNVASITITSASLESFQETIGENLLRMRFFNVLFSIVIAFGVVYNSARISLSERSRELATLRVIGFTNFEVSAILLGELTILTLLAIPLGLGLGYGMAAVTTLGLDTELYRVPLVVNRSTFGFAAVVVVMATAISSFIVRRRIDHLDLVGVLKTRE